MAAEYKDNYGPLRGTKQWVVRGSIYLSEPREDALRPRIDEYPERWPLDPLFPQAGERTGSRPPSKQGAPATGVAGGPGGEGGTAAAGPEPVVDIYPSPRPREFDLSIGGPVSGSAPGLGGCLEEGDTLRNSPQVPAAGGIRSFSTRRIVRPFVITHIQYWSTNVVPSSVSDVGLTIFIADENAVTLTALVPSGRPLDFWEGGPILEPHSVRTDHYPMLRVSEAGKFIKMQWVNAGAAAVETMLSISWKYT